MNVLHVSSHYGGGVKSIISAWIKHDRENSHTLTYLNPDPENDKPGRFFFTPDIVPDYDIVICHVWNHPALWDFISNTPLPPCRLIGWSHMAGLKPPYILFEKLINYFDEFIYTSPVSNRCGIEKPYIWSCCDIDEFLSIEKRDHTGFNIGYIGTVDFCKMHPDFIQICSMIPEGHFTVIGGGSDLQTVKDQAEALGISHRFTFTGQIQDIKPYLSEMDVFLYPLSPNHYGTCEQILGEVMAAGIPCVTLNNPAENFIILNEGTGFICKDYNEIVSKIKLLQSEKNILDSKKIKNHAKKIYSVENKIKYWKIIFENIIEKEKTLRKWEGETDSPFLESLGRFKWVFTRSDAEIKAIFRSNPQWASENKGSIRQYLRFYPDNKLLMKLEKLL